MALCFQSNSSAQESNMRVRHDYVAYLEDRDSVHYKILSWFINTLVHSLVVILTKGSGLSLEFGVTALPDEICIDSLTIKLPEGSEDQLAYEGPEFNDLDENLQKALHKYLEIRGIKPSTTNFLHEYMGNKENKEYLMWLKNIKNFIEK